MADQNSALNVVTIGGMGHSIEKLAGTKNYNNWKFSMRMLLTMEGLWNCVLGTDNDVNKDQKALAKICLSVKPSSQVAG